MNKNRMSNLFVNPKNSSDNPIISSLNKLCKEGMGEFQFSQEDINKTVEKVYKDSEGNNKDWLYHYKEIKRSKNYK